MRKLKKLWKLVQLMTGERDYDNYLMHFQQNSCKKNNHKPLSRKEFYAKKMTEKWSGINRCC